MLMMMMTRCDFGCRVPHSVSKAEWMGEGEEEKGRQECGREGVALEVGKKSSVSASSSTSSALASFTAAAN